MEETSSTFSVTHAIDTLGFGKFQILLSIAMGFANLADAMEMMILSVLAPALECHWHITEFQKASLTTVVFLGMLISSIIWGKMADKYGRRPVLIIATFFLAYFGFLTSFSPTYGWVIFIRFLVGFFIGAIPQSCTMYAEFLPTAVRGRAIMVMSFFWAIGSCLEAALALAIMPSLGWRYLVGVSVLPLVCFLFFSPIIPESLLYLGVTGQKPEAEHLISKIARLNGKKPPAGHLELAADETSKAVNPGRGRITDLFSGDRKRLTLMVWPLWFVAAFTYYGVVLVSSELLNSSQGVCSAQHSSIQSSMSKVVEQECSVHQCRGLSEADYTELLWTTVAEFPGTLIAIVLIDWVGRKKTLAICAASGGIATLVVMECSYSRTLLVIMLFVSRGMSSAFFQAVYVYTPEVYPTSLRAVAIGSGSASARIGAMLTPFLAQVVLKKSIYGTMTVYSLLCFVAATISWYLPVETSGISLAASDHQFQHKEFTNETEELPETEDQQNLDLPLQRF